MMYKENKTLQDKQHWGGNSNSATLHHSTTVCVSDREDIRANIHLRFMMLYDLKKTKKQYWKHWPIPTIEHFWRQADIFSYLKQL